MTKNDMWQGNQLPAYEIKVLTAKALAYKALASHERDLFTSAGVEDEQTRKVFLS